MYGRTYGLAAVVWENGQAIDTNCPGRKPIRYNTAGQPVWGMTSQSGWAARPILNPDQIPCGAKQVEVKTHKPITNLAKAAAIGAGAIALTSLGGGVLKASSGVLTKSAGVATGTAAGSAESAGMFAAIKDQGNKILNFVNQGRAINAIANGEIPPLPISISGDSFLEWGMQVATDELKKKYQRDLTRAEEEALRLEMAQIQQQMQNRAGNLPMSPSPAVPEAVQREQQKVVIETEKKKDDSLMMLLALGLPAILILAMNR